MALLKDSLITGDLRVTGTIYGNATSANKLATARTIQTNLASTSSASFNGTGNITPGVSGILGIANGGTGNSSGIPYGFSSRGDNATWGNTTGTTIVTWNDSTGGSIDFRRDNPSGGKMSLKVDGRFYFNEGATPVGGLKSANNYWGMTGPDGEDNIWIRTTSNGLLPYQSGGAGSGHQSIGTSSWYFNSAYIDNIYGSLTGHASSDLPLTGGILTGGLEIKGHIAGDTGSSGHGLWGGGGYHNAYNNIILHGDASTGTSGIAFVSDKGGTTINQPSDRAFIQWHAHGVTTYTAESTNPTLATSGENNILVIGVGNDVGDQIRLQSPAVNGLLHQVGATGYVIPSLSGTTTTANHPLISTTTAGLYANNTSITMNGGTLTATKFVGNLATNNLVPTITKTYASTDYYSTNDSWDNSSWYFMSAKPDSWYKTWKVRFKVRSYCPSYTNEDSTSWVEIYGRNNGITSYKIYNEFYDRGHYYINAYPLTKTGFDAGYGVAIGVSIRYANNYTNSAHYRTFIVDYYDCEGCTVTLLDTPVKWASWTGTGTTNYGGLSAFDAQNRGLRESGDDNSYDLLQMSNNYLTNGSQFRFAPNTIFGFDRAGNAQGFSLYSSEYTGGTVSINTARVYNTTGIDWTRGLYYKPNGSNHAKSANLDIHIRNAATACDLRYTDNCVPTSAASTLGMLPRKPVYFRGVIKSDGLFYLAPISVTYNSATYQRVWTQDIPTAIETDGTYQYVYWFIGYPYYNGSYANGQYQINVEAENKMYWFHNGRFEEYTETANTVIGTNLAANPAGALLQSGPGRPDSSPAGDTWIYWDTLGGASSYWGIKHNQAANTIGFYGGGTQRCLIHLGESKITCDNFTGNAATATKLQTARTISLTGSVTGSGTFDGSGNLSITTTTNHTHSYLPLAGGTMSGVINTTYKSGTWVNSLTSSAISLSDASGSYGGWICGPTKNGRIAISSYQSNDDKLYFGYGERGRTTNSFAQQMVWDGPTNTLTASKVYGAVWNDFAEYRQGKNNPGKVMVENGDDSVSISTKRLQPGASICSDTFGFAIGETEDCKCPIAVAGRVLAYPLEPREEYNFFIGQAVCSGPDGTVSIMTKDEVKEYPECIVGYISAVPKYETWGTGNVKVDGRVWIKVK